MKKRRISGPEDEDKVKTQQDGRWRRSGRKKGAVGSSHVGGPSQMRKKWGVQPDRKPGSTLGSEGPCGRGLILPMLKGTQGEQVGGFWGDFGA